MTYNLTEQLDGIAELLQQIRPRVAAPADRPELARIDAWARSGVVLDLGRGTTFAPHSASAESYTDSGGTIRDATVLVYGEARFRELIDRGAVVHVSPRHAWARTSAWDGKTFRGLPDGARNRIAEAVRDAVSPVDFDAVGTEHVAGKADAELRNSASEAHRALAGLLRKLGGADR